MFTNLKGKILVAANRKPLRRKQVVGLSVTVDLLEAASKFYLGTKIDVEAIVDYSERPKTVSFYYSGNLVNVEKKYPYTSTLSFDEAADGIEIKVVSVFEGGMENTKTYTVDVVGTVDPEVPQPPEQEDDANFTFVKPTNTVVRVGENVSFDVETPGIEEGIKEVKYYVNGSYEKTEKIFRYTMDTVFTKIGINTVVVIALTDSGTTITSKPYKIIVW